MQQPKKKQTSVFESSWPECHTIQFKTELYKEVCQVVRDYHPMDWTLVCDTDYKLDFPFARNRVSGEQVYGS